MSLSKLLQKAALGIGLTVSACGGTEVPMPEPVIEEPKRTYTCESASKMVVDNCLTDPVYHCDRCEDDLVRLQKHIETYCLAPPRKQDPTTPPELVNFNLYTYCAENLCGVRVNDDYLEEAARRFPNCVPQNLGDCYFIFLLNGKQGTSCE